MKIKMLMIVFLSSSLWAMQPQQETIAQLPVYTLVGSDNSEVQISGDLARKYALGLAQKFRIGFPEAHTGKVVIHDLDQHALQNFKTLLEETAKLEEIQTKRVEALVKQTEKAQEDIILPEGQKQQEIEQRGKILMQGLLETTKIMDETAARIKDIVTELSNIGDHFLNLFNNIAQWSMPYSLEAGLAKFAAEQLDFNNPNDYQELTEIGFSPIAQLYYLQEVSLTVDNIVKAYGWLARLSHSAEVNVVKKNQEIIERVFNKIVDFIVINIQEILKKNPQMRAILLDPNNKLFADIVRAEIIKMYQPMFEKKIMEIKEGGIQQFDALDNERILINTSKGEFIINLKKHEQTKIGKRKLGSYSVLHNIPLDQSHILKKNTRTYASTGLFEAEFVLIDSNTNKILRVFPHYSRVAKLDKNHIAAIFSKSKGLKFKTRYEILLELQEPIIETILLTFIPEVSTLAEILDELQAQPVLFEEVRAKRPAPAAAPQPKQQPAKKAPAKRVKKEEEPK